jgi:hypothetical protein
MIGQSMLVVVSLLVFLTNRIKFLDECHFSRKKLKKRKVWGVRSKRVYTKDTTLSMFVCVAFERVRC